MDTTFVSEKMSRDWSEAYVNTANKGEALLHPPETLVRLFKGDYVTGKRLDMEGKSVLDVGFGDGNTFAFLASMGMKIHGVEIDEAICTHVSKRLERLGMSVDLRVGANQSLPFPDNSFDYLVSWNVLHYEGSEENICASLKEYARVLKPGGRLFLSTTGPTHKILLNAKVRGSHCYEIGRPNDFRQGQIHFFFDSPRYLEFYFGAHFKDLQIGRIEDVLFREKLDWWLVTGVK